MYPIVAIGSLFGVLVLVLVIWALGLRADVRRVQHPDVGGNELSLRGPLALYGASIIGIPLLMIAFSIALPALRNPLFLMIGALLGGFLPSVLLNGSRFWRFALLAGLILAAACFALLLIWMQM